MSLVLTRKFGDKVLIDDGRIVITVVKIKGKQVKLGIDCAKELKISRLDRLDDQSENRGNK